MRVPDEVRECVGFVGCDAGSGRRLAGTFFLVSMKLSENHVVVYAVTAAHVIDGVAAATADGKVHLRVNADPAGTQWVATDLTEWKRHPSDPWTVDVAVLEFHRPSDPPAVRFVPIDGAATSEIIASRDIGVGDEVFLPGLFVNHFGRDRNIPVVRTGTIAAMPTEPTQTQRGAFLAYLVEARSIGGLSGSPVFVHLPRLGLDISGDRRGDLYLLGLMHGHWDIDLPATDASHPDGLEVEVVNMGIGIVVPVSRIRETLDDADLAASREHLRAEVERLDIVN
jgi:hypothetical protein